MPKKARWLLRGVWTMDLWNRVWLAWLRWCGGVRRVGWGVRSVRRVVTERCGSERRRGQRVQLLVERCEWEEGRSSEEAGLRPTLRWAAAARPRGRMLR